MEKQKHNATKTILLRCIVFICISAVLGSGFVIVHSLLEYTKGADAYEDIQQYVILPESSVEETSTIADVSDGDTQWPQIDFKALWQINPDVIAWLYCEGTAINYPVVQGHDNEYYLHRLLDDTWNIAGSLFLDCNNQTGFKDHNSIIYGHNLKDKSMFWCIAEYKKQEYYAAHPVILLITPEQNYEIQLFSGYVADPQKPEETWLTWFSSNSEFQAWIDATVQRSTFASEVTPSAADSFVTLSTCSYEWDDARYVVVGQLVSEAELD